MENIIVRIGWSGDNFSASAEIGGVVVVTAKTIKELKKEMESLLAFHIQGMIEDNDPMPDDIKNGNYKIEYIEEASTILKRLDGILTRSAISRVTGIAQTQLGRYFKGRAEATEEIRSKIIKGIETLQKELDLVVA